MIFYPNTPSQNILPWHLFERYHWYKHSMNWKRIVWFMFILLWNIYNIYTYIYIYIYISWCRHHMDAFPVLLVLCEGKPPAIGGFPSQWPMTWSFDVFFDLCLHKRLSKQLRHRWFKTLPVHNDVTVMIYIYICVCVCCVYARVYFFAGIQYSDFDYGNHPSIIFILWNV